MCCCVSKALNEEVYIGMFTYGQKIIELTIMVIRYGHEYNNFLKKKLSILHGALMGVDLDERYHL